MSYVFSLTFLTLCFKLWQYLVTKADVAKWPQPLTISCWSHSLCSFVYSTKKLSVSADTCFVYVGGCQLARSKLAVPRLYPFCWCICKSWSTSQYCHGWRYQQVQTLLKHMFRICRPICVSHDYLLSALNFVSHYEQRLRLPCHVSFVGTDHNAVTEQQQQQQHPFNGPLPETTRVSRYQKGKTNLDLLEQEVLSGIGISWAICKSAPRPRQITMPAPHHSVFYMLDALPAAQPTASKHWRQKCSAEQFE